MTEQLPVKCIVKGCQNHYRPEMYSTDFAGVVFYGELCAPCHATLVTGAVLPDNPTFIGDLYRVATLLKDLIGGMSVEELIERTRKSLEG